jgi:hypothetical protein
MTAPLPGDSEMMPLAHVHAKHFVPELFSRRNVVYVGGAATIQHRSDSRGGVIMKRRIIGVAILVTLFFQSISAQLSLDTYSANLGMIRTTYSGDPYPRYVLYPEFQVSGNLYNASLLWAGYWGYWTDGVDKAFDIKDMVTFSRQVHILGFRVIFIPPNGVIGVFGGIARHYTSVHYLGGSDGVSSPQQYSDESVTNFELGIIIDLHIYGSWNILGELHQFLPVGKISTYPEQNERRAFTIGIGYKFL